MSRIADETIEQVRDSADLIAIVGESVALKRTGSDYRGPCPFHGGTNRNFAIIPKKGRYYCFVCHESGDVFSWFMKRFGMDYPTAIREVARRAGIVIPEESTGPASDPREPLYEALAAAQDWYSKQLFEDPKASAARDYLESRHVTLSTAGELGLGFASPGSAFVQAMSALGIPGDRLLEAGLLVKRDDGSTPPRFRSRLLFPIHDLRGRVVGFGGRVLGDTVPKYLNSPETPVFRKGSLLYNLHLAKHAIRKEETAIVVEGYFDVISMSLAGIENVVAPLGTAMTSDQAALLQRSAKQAILLYDSDQAGLRATFRAGDELLRHGIRVKVATLPPGEDPDTIVRNGDPAKLVAVLRDAVDLMERKIQLLSERGWLEDLSRRRAALDRLLPTVRVTKDPITRDLYFSLISQQTGVSREVLRQEVDLLPALTVEPPESATLRRITKRAETDSWRKRDEVAERYLTYILITSPTWLERAREELPLNWLRCTQYAEIYSALLAASPGEVSGAIDLLSENARRAYDLLVKNETYEGIDIDASYIGSHLALEARPFLESVREVLVKLRSERDAEAKAELASEHRRLREEISARFPLDWIKHVFKKSFLGDLKRSSISPSDTVAHRPAKRSAS